MKMYTKLKYLPIAAVAAVALSLAGCGGGGDDPVATSSTPPTMGPTGPAAPALTTKEALTAAQDDLDVAMAALTALQAKDDPAATRVEIAMAEDEVEAAMMARDAAEVLHTAYVYALPENVAARAAAATAESLGIAMAINPPMDAANGNGLPASATATRTTAGVTTVTLMNSAENVDESDVAFEPAYASSMDAMTPEIDGWSGDTQTRATDPAEHVTVYTNIKSAKPMKLTYTGASVIPTGAGNLIVLDDGTEGYTGIQDDDDNPTVAGTVNGIPGTFTCTTGSCTVEFVDEGPGVSGNTVETLTGVGWAFASTENVESEAKQVADYLYFGSWLQMADADGDYAFGTFSGGDMPYIVTNMSNVKGTATYDGAAAGRYVMKDLELVGGQVMPTSATQGQFTATAALTAYFGGVDIPMSKHYSIHGTVTEFMDGDTPLDFELKLESETFGEDAASFPEGTASGRNGSVLSSIGNWSAAFFGNSEPTADETDDATFTNQPSGVAGEFVVHFPDAHVAGGFGATR